MKTYRNKQGLMECVHPGCKNHVCGKVNWRCDKHSWQYYAPYIYHWIKPFILPGSAINCAILDQEELERLEQDEADIRYATDSIEDGNDEEMLDNASD